MKQKSAVIHSPVVRSLKFNKIAIEVIVAILLLVWLHTGISKLIDHRSFQVQLTQNPIFHNIATLASYAGPILEIILAILLIPKKTRLWGLAGSFFLMGFFSWYVYYLMTTLPSLPCSCGGIVGWLNWPQHLTLNIFLTVISLIGFFLVRKQKRIHIK